MTFALLADIGGTNARFALAGKSGPRDARILKVADYAGPAQAAAAYLEGRSEKITHAAFAMAGPINGDRFELTNFPWAFSIEDVRETLGLERLDLLNDFYALALGVPGADPQTVTQIGGGTAQAVGNIGIIGPGTGLGIASLIWDAKSAKYLPVAGEGGHVTLPPINAREQAIVAWLLEHKYSHVSAERVCSGKGLLNLYDALRGIDQQNLPDLEAAEITARAIAGSCLVCREALTLMLAFLGRVAGNLALTNSCFGGVYLAGGILPKLGIPYIQASRLRGEFIAKGRATTYVDRIPLFMIDDPFLALRGLCAHIIAA